nr:MAG TPA: hypothetical protein [Caudoviricetes sp.]
MSRRQCLGADAVLTFPALAGFFFTSLLRLT